MKPDNLVSIPGRMATQAHGTERAMAIMTEISVLLTALLNCIFFALQQLSLHICHQLWYFPGSEVWSRFKQQKKISARWQQTASQNKQDRFRKPL